MIETIATKAVDQNAEILTDLAKKIWEYPETAFNEVKACEWTAEVLRNAGFDVEVGYVGMEKHLFYQEKVVQVNPL